MRFPAVSAVAAAAAAAAGVERRRRPKFHPDVPGGFVATTSRCCSWCCCTRNRSPTLRSRRLEGVSLPRDCAAARRACCARGDVVPASLPGFSVMLPPPARRPPRLPPPRLRSPRLLLAPVLASPSAESCRAGKRPRWAPMRRQTLGEGRRRGPTGPSCCRSCSSRRAHPAGRSACGSRGPGARAPAPGASPWTRRLPLPVPLPVPLPTWSTRRPCCAVPPRRSSCCRRRLLPLPWESGSRPRSRHRYGVVRVRGGRSARGGHSPRPNEQPRQPCSA